MGCLWTFHMRTKVSPSTSRCWSSALLLVLEEEEALAKCRRHMRSAPLLAPVHSSVNFSQVSGVGVAQIPFLNEGKGGHPYGKGEEEAEEGFKGQAQAGALPAC